MYEVASYFNLRHLALQCEELRSLTSNDLTESLLAQNQMTPDGQSPNQYSNNFFPQPELDQPINVLDMIHTGDSPPDELPVSAVNHAVTAVHQEVVHSHTSIGGLKNLNQTAHNNDHTNLDSLLQHGQIPNTPSQRFESQQISRNDNQKDSINILF